MQANAISCQVEGAKSVLPRDSRYLYADADGGWAYVEAATVGREGASWLSAAAGAPSMPCETIVALDGWALSIDIHRLEEEIERNGAFQKAVSRYAHALLIHALRTGSCNALHSLEQRCARWLLTAMDRTDPRSFAVTQDVLASLIGCCRPVLTHILPRS